jgi:hypothetical protein
VDVLSADLDVPELLEQLGSIVQSGACMTISTLVAELRNVNERLWDAEDFARNAVDDKALAGAKRVIDHLNLERNGLIEEIDTILSDGIARCNRVMTATKAPLHTETIGSVIDRLVILALRINRTRAASLGDAALSGRIAHLENQHTELATALAALIEDVATGVRRLPDGRRFKLYGGGRDGSSHESNRNQ